MSIDDYLAGLAGPLREIGDIDPAPCSDWLRAAAHLEEA
ncbi:hypothetical protein MED15_06193 [Micromonospora noduli]|uniref:Uncharacterized protein n=1 Tax=Micromonospora noduli TaxID=709876 RepID=A0ABX9CU66_9ACTN|nr:hypothetical protein MED15_06193 [Micromonospora noduli]RAO10086.1 hypothetical protein LUPAC07_05298 [Micromonospora noduli]RAO29070.1 hypothetical protein ONO86_05845 [Micromonospora noduli]